MVGGLLLEGCGCFVEMLAAMIAGCAERKLVALKTLNHSFPLRSTLVVLSPELLLVHVFT